MTHEQIITEKCKQAGCTDKEKSRHFRLYVHETWDVHPPDGFVAWWPRHPEAGACDVITAWNTDRNRKQFVRWNLGESEPEPPELTEDQREKGMRFLAELRIRTHRRGGSA